MTLQEQQDALEEIKTKMTSIMLAKGDDYANEDRLSNFKQTGEITGIGAELSCLNLAATKIARLGNLLSTSKDPNNESIDDSIIDLINYGALLYMIRLEKQKTTK